MTRTQLYQMVCRQHGLRLVVGLLRWKVMDRHGASLAPAVLPARVRSFIDGYVTAMQRAQAGDDVEPLVLLDFPGVSGHAGAPSGAHPPSDGR